MCTLLSLLLIILLYYISRRGHVPVRGHRLLGAQRSAQVYRQGPHLQLGRRGRPGLGRCLPVDIQILISTQYIYISTQVDGAGGRGGGHGAALCPDGGVRGGGVQTGAGQRPPARTRPRPALVHTRHSHAHGTSYISSYLLIYICLCICAQVYWYVLESCSAQFYYQ